MLQAEKPEKSMAELRIRTRRIIQRKDRTRKNIDGVNMHKTPKAFRTALLSPAEHAYLEMIEADGRLDRAASTYSYLLTVDAERTGQQQWPSSVMPIQSDTCLLNQLKNVLVSDDGSPIALLKAALVLAADAQNRWTWAVELYLLAALSSLTDGGPDEAMCLFVIGQLYGTADTKVASSNRPAARSIRFLEWARRAADGHCADWLLPKHMPPWSEETSSSGGSSIWTAVCSAEHTELLKAARKLDPDRALRAVRAASRLADLCGGVDDGRRRRRRAVVAYELGTRHAAVGAPDRAAEAFERCAEIATGLDADLELEARLEAVQAALDRADDDVLKRLTDDAMDRRNGRLTMKAMAARGRLAAYRDRPDDAYRYSTSTVRMDEEHDNDADVDSARLHAAIGLTCTFLQANFWLLNDREFDLLAKPCLWMDDHRIRTRSEYNDGGTGGGGGNQGGHYDIGGFEESGFGRREGRIEIVTS